jgi:predicted O-methyltransferase YrrM
MPTRSFLSIARRAYRQAVAPLGNRKLQNMMADGLPHQFYRPLVFLFDRRLTEAEQQVARRLDLMRSDIASLNREFAVVNRNGYICQLTAEDIASRISVDREFGMLLYLCVESFGARTILELGACAGLSACYLASAKICERLLTVEASAELASLARANLAKVSDGADVLNASFNSALDQILPSLATGIDMAYIDGHHDYEATLNYFHRLQPYLNKGALVVFDDIHLSEGMWRAWQALKQQAGFGYTVDAGRFGMCLWDGVSRSAINYDLSRYVGWLRNMSQFTHRAASYKP